ncbi:ABC transporter ATP-binding protein [Streptosporangium sp. NBC_01495]|uniref:ABC transporter ATP-binding protein n=1 Tax=Streptosporangium sp. NBC_01495 TaxID=2903899 RepID=UPI002E31948E|nr:ABC transporter ATP-binding protein [Streptosporangium sp. NBC_01495]
MTDHANDAVSLRGVTKRFGAVRAVNDLSLDIPAGQTVALLGPNGAGKSTTIGLLLGLLAPDSGTVRVLGDTPETAVRNGRLAAMPQEGGLVSRSTVRELVGFVSGTYPAPLPLEEVLATAGLEELADRRMERLSGGQAQRVRFALALAGDPELILLDEPTAALDVRARREFWESMRAFAARGRTVLFSTHYLEEADEYADRVVVIDRGRIAADGTSREIKRLVALSTVSVTATGDTAPLERLPGVVSVEIRGERAHLRTRDADATVVALAAAGAVRDLEVVPTALEDAFLSLTGQAEQAGPAEQASGLTEVDA